MARPANHREGAACRGSKVGAEGTAVVAARVLGCSAQAAPGGWRRRRRRQACNLLGPGRCIGRQLPSPSPCRGWASRFCLHSAVACPAPCTAAPHSPPCVKYSAGARTAAAAAMSATPGVLLGGAGVCRRCSASKTAAAAVIPANRVTGRIEGSAGVIQGSCQGSPPAMMRGAARMRSTRSMPAGRPGMMLRIDHPTFSSACCTQIFIQKLLSRANAPVEQAKAVQGRRVHALLCRRERATAMQGQFGAVHEIRFIRGLQGKRAARCSVQGGQLGAGHRCVPGT